MIDPKDEEIEFVDTLLSPERSIFSSKKLLPGEYIILVEVYWEQEEHSDFTLGTYSEGPVILERLNDNSNVYNMSEYMIWKSFANQKRGTLDKMNPNYIYDQGKNVTVEANKYKNQNYAMVLYDYLNTDTTMTAHQVIGVNKHTGFEIVSASKSGNNCDLVINPGENDVILFKMNPRAQTFSLSHRVVQEELLEKNFSKPYQTVFEMLVNLGSVSANPNNKSRGAGGNSESKIQSKIERIRKMKESEGHRHQKIENQRKKQFHKSKVGKYDPMNYIDGFGGGCDGINHLFHQSGISKGWDKWGKDKPGKYSNFRGLKGVCSDRDHGVEPHAHKQEAQPRTVKRYVNRGGNGATVRSHPNPENHQRSKSGLPIQKVHTDHKRNVSGTHNSNRGSYGKYTYNLHGGNNNKSKIN